MYLVGRLAGHVETLELLFSPTAAEIFRANVAFGVDEDDAVVAALADVDSRVRRLRSLLGEELRDVA